MNRYIDNLSNLNLICMQAFNLYTIHKRLSVGQAQTGEYKANLTSPKDATSNKTSAQQSPPLRQFGARPSLLTWAGG